MNRMYSILAVKAVEDDERVIRGTATTPKPDRMNDVVDPLGVKFKNPLPLLHQHDSNSPVGTVKFDKPTKAGITFEARLPKIEEPGPLKDRVDTAWGEVKAGLVRAVSIGFRALEYSFMDDGGINFIASEVLELSLVTVPANADCTITQIRSIDAPVLAATGKEPKATDRPVPPGVTGKAPLKPVKSMPKEGRTMKKTIAEQISAFEATRLAKSAEMDAIMDAAAEKGETLDADQKETYDTLRDEVKEIDEHLVRLREREKSVIASAKAAKGADELEAGRSRIPGVQTVQVNRDLPKGTIFTRFIAAKIVAKMDGGISAFDYANAKFADTPEVAQILKAAVAAGNTTDSTWAAPLVQLQQATNEFLDLLRPATIIGRITGLTRVPFNIRVPLATADPTAYWVGEGQVKPVSAAAFDSATLAFAKAVGISVMTEELLRFSTPSAEALLRNGLINAVAYLTDRTFVDPTAASTGSSPASVTYGVSAVAPTGTTADAFRDDFATLIATYLAANYALSGLVILMTSQQALKLSLMRNTLGNKEFPELGVNGGSIEGVPVITSENIPAAGGSPVDGYPIIALHAPSILLADDGGVNIDMSREASLQMDSAPDSPATASTVMVSMWQQNMVAIKAERFITWKKARSGAVQYIQGGRYA
jgi:HK97 family phage major capsid protein/HK97 family phage prohead protease